MKPLYVEGGLGGSALFILLSCLFTPVKLQPSKEIFPPLCFHSPAPGLCLYWTCHCVITICSNVCHLNKALLHLCFQHHAQWLGWNRCSVSACCMNKWIGTVLFYQTPYQCRVCLAKLFYYLVLHSRALLLWFEQIEWNIKSCRTDALISLCSHSCWSI